ncbi:hypothetical protein ACQHIV_22735 [Kribbella sp. GL6]|uniref:hypothetical protein n=1 Tax=Kribbella sp. GL6 TaxID=3419765 RepID=UPI003D0768EA
MSRPTLRGRRAALAVSTLAMAGLLCAAGPADAAPRTGLTPGSLVVSRLHYVGTPGLLAPGQVLPTGATAVADGSFARVWDNVTVDGNFGVTAPIYLDQLDAAGATVASVEAPTGRPGPSSRGHDVLTGSFSSKSEGALNLSTDGSRLTVMGYVAAPNTLDASNGNTPGVIDPTNPDAQSVYRGIGEVDAKGQFFVTQTNAYSGDNGRAAIYDAATGLYYAAGNSNNGEGTSVPGTIYGTGAQLVTPARESEAEQTVGQPTPLGGFSVLQLPGVKKADKLGKDTNFGAVAVHNGVVYYTKGSGSNGVDTVYFVDTTGAACPNGVGVPVPGAPAPTAAQQYNAATGEIAPNMCILKGFPTALAKSVATPEVGGPENTTAFGAMWFANDTTLYVADAGNGDDTYSSGVYTGAAAQTLAGIQKWSLVNGTWTYAYTLQNGLGLGRPYSAAGLPAGTNVATGLPWQPAVDGVRNITGKVNADGSVSLYGVTSTVGGVTDPGANPNKVVTVTDQLGATTQPGGQTYRVLRSAAAGDVYRGTAFAPR